ITADAAPVINARSLVVSNGQVFFRTREAAVARQTTTRVSVASGGTQGNDSSGSPGNLFFGAPSISADGRFVAFATSATNLVPGDTNGVVAVFVQDASATGRAWVGLTGVPAHVDVTRVGALA